MYFRGPEIDEPLANLRSVEAMILKQLLLNCFVLSFALAQPFLRQVDAIPVTANGSPIALPFAGGVDSPMHQFVDIDGDGDFDLFVLDNDLVATFYRNEGTPSVANYKLRTDATQLPSFSRFFLFVDYDGDGLMDLATEDSIGTGIRIYKNVGTPSNPVFALDIPTLLDVNNNPVFPGTNSIPAFVDIDADGDLDFFSSNAIGTVNYYENVGSSTKPLYHFVTDFWQNILVLGDTCTNTFLSSARHGASAFRFADIDGDGDLDFFVGDINWTGLFFIQNIGTPQSPQMQCNTSHYPLNDPVNTQGFNQASLVDIDGDGDLDLFVGVIGGIEQTHGFWFYRNNGSAVNPSFQLQTEDYLSVIDVGRNAHPAFVDIDADGDQDLFVGGLEGRLAFFQNTGSTTVPSFSLVDTAYQNITGGFLYVPSFVDIDNDGDKDLFLSSFSSPMKFYRNIGNAQSAVFVHQSSPVDTINFSQYNAATFVDIDNDGDVDMFVGTVSGRISFYRNVGSPSLFLPHLETTSYGNIVVQNPIPTFTDIDGDGDFDLFIGTEEGRVEFYQNTGTPTNAQFVRITNHYANTEATSDAAPAFVDIDNDGDKDFFIGVGKGGIHFYRNELITSVEPAPEIPQEAFLAQNFPNPFNGSTSIGLQIADNGFVSLKVYDVLGREVATLVNEVKERGRYTVSWDASHMVSGVYFYRLSTPTLIVTKKLLLLR